MSSDPADATPRLVLGTAGHIDHGKTALVRALTGVETDRLPEERARGITIELGFAPLDLEAHGERIRLSVVDVPGHEGLVRTMVSGATGIDLVLLVVAADEGVMPQTREHAAICELLGLRRGVVALTKTDLVASDVIELATDEVRALLADTALEAAPIVPVSARSGDGLERLRETLLEATRAAAPRTPRTGPPRFGVDRVFAQKGFGTIVTGTLVGGGLDVGETLVLHPSGRRGRVRGLQSHGVAVERALPGIRCAVNLQGVEVAEITRGDVLTLPDALIPTHTLDVTLRWLRGVPPLEAEASVGFLAGTLRRHGHVALVGASRLEPGESGLARIHLEGEPVHLLPGDRFIVRGFARTAEAGSTLGGGVVLDVAPQRLRRGDPALLRSLGALVQRDPAIDLQLRIARSELAGTTREALAQQTGLGAAALDAALGTLAASGAIVATASDRWLGAQAAAELEARILAALEAHHQVEPLHPGMPRGALRGKLPNAVDASGMELALARLAGSGRIALEGGGVRCAAHQPRLAAGDAAALEEVHSVLREAGLEPPGLRELSDRVRAPAQHLRKLLAHLERSGAIVRAPGDLWFDRGAIDALRERLLGYLRLHGAIDTPAYKALIGTPRRTAVPLMELFDAQRLTLRSGERRVLRTAKASEGDPPAAP
jgi:selenocysteine-specific elongation factor